jgi:hypothetical protein
MNFVINLVIIGMTNFFIDIYASFKQEIKIIIFLILSKDNFFFLPFHWPQMFYDFFYRQFSKQLFKKVLFHELYKLFFFFGAMYPIIFVALRLFLFLL